MNKDALIRFEEDCYDSLVEKFIEKHADLWGVFVLEQYSEYDIDLTDFWYDYHKDEQALQTQRKVQSGVQNV